MSLTGLMEGGERKWGEHCIDILPSACGDVTIRSFYISRVENSTFRLGCIFLFSLIYDKQYIALN